MDRRKEQFFVAWADCDAAGKVFYPNFYGWFDRSTEKLFRANGLTFAELESEFGIIGMPLLESNAKYERACLHGSELSIETWIDEWASKAFVVRHRITQQGDRLAVSGFEKRIFVVAAPDEPSGMRGIAPPDEILVRLSEDA
jgi:4-hydroxybenzoyl-CoA thioesterase